MYVDPSGNLTITHDKIHMDGLVEMVEKSMLTGARSVREAQDAIKFVDQAVRDLEATRFIYNAKDPRLASGWMAQVYGPYTHRLFELKTKLQSLSKEPPSPPSSSRELRQLPLHELHRYFPFAPLSSLEPMAVPSKKSDFP